MAKQSRVLKPVAPFRRSPRLQQLTDPGPRTALLSQQPSPSPSQAKSTTQAQKSSTKRKLDQSTEVDQVDELFAKQLSGQRRSGSIFSTDDPVAVWVATSNWPKLTGREPIEMPVIPCRRTDESDTLKQSSVHHAIRQRQLQESHVYFPAIELTHRDSKELCESLRQGERRPTILPGYPPHKVTDALRRAQPQSEALLQRDVTPWVVPSPQHLFLADELTEDYIGEEIQTSWSRCDILGSSRPKPDVTIGLQRSAFTRDEWAKLENCATSSSSFLTSPNLWFPFLICEVKTARSGLEKADTQNIHSGSIAVRSILRVCIAAYGRKHEKVQELLGRILVFTVSHDSRVAMIYGHCAAATSDASEAGEDFGYHRYEVGCYNLASFIESERYGVYNFVRNLYDSFAPQHVKRLKDTIAVLDNPGPRTRASFVALSLDHSDEIQSNAAEAANQSPGGVFKVPTESASSMVLKELEAHLEEQKAQLEAQLKEQKAQLNEQKAQFKEQRERDDRAEQEWRQERREANEQIAKLMELLAAESK